MRFAPVRKITVLLDLEDKRSTLGTLAWSSRERRAYFEYAPEALAAPLLLSPFHLMAQPGVLAAPRDPFDGLHGLFNDSLPDGWGRLLLDRRLRKAGIDHLALTPLDRLSAVGQTGMGALAYIPELEGEARTAGDLDWFVEQVAMVHADLDTADLGALQGAEGGSAGARPKIMIGFNPDPGRFVLDYGQPLEAGYERWIVKAASREDPEAIGPEEQAYALMARRAGVDMAETHLFETRQGTRLFATRRFDRTSRGRLHMQTASALLNASHREASLGYQALAKLTFLMTRDHAAVLQMFRRMVFNVMAHNRDDHAKNHAFRMDSAGRWTLSPSYDLTFSSGPGGEHSADVAGEGRAPGLPHMLAVAKAASIAPREAHAIIEEVRGAVSRWRDCADEACLPKRRADEIDTLFNKG